MNSFRHSGKLGDIIYSLPAVRALGGGCYFVDYRTEYFGKPPLGERTARMMIDLLRTQSYIHQADLYDGRPVTCDLDRFRDAAMGIHVFNTFRNNANHIMGTLFGDVAAKAVEKVIPKIEVDLPQCHWDCVALPGKADVDTPWLSGIPKKSVADIVICKTDRYAGKFDWSVLHEFGRRAVFVGLEEEFRAFCATHFIVDFYEAINLIDLAQVIAGAKLFVGNQSFVLALADAVAVPRVVQTWDESPNRVSAPNVHSALTRDVVRAYADGDLPTRPQQP